MPKLNISQLQQAAPAQVNAPLKVPTDDGAAALGQALVNAGNQFGRIGAQIAQQQIASEVAEAETSALIQLSTLKTTLSKQGAGAVVANFDVDAEVIKSDLIENMSPGARQKFLPAFNRAYAQSRITAMSDGLKVDHQEAIAVGFAQLDRLEKGQTETGIDYTLAETTGLKVLNELVAKNALDPKKAQARRTKFQDKLAKNHIARFINNAGDYDDLVELEANLRKGEFEDPALSKSWMRLDQTEKRALISNLRTEMSRLITQEKYIDEETERQAKSTANKLKTDFISLLLKPPSPQRTNDLQKIITDLSTIWANNPDVSVTTLSQLQQMQDQVRSGGDRGQRDDTVYYATLQKVMRGATSIGAIINIEKGLTTEDKTALINQIQQGTSRENTQALDELESTPEFLPITRYAYEKGKLTRQQSKVLNAYIKLRNNAIRENKDFDAVGVMRDLIKNEIKDVRQTNEGREQQKVLRIMERHNINGLEGAQRLLNNPPRQFTPNEQRTIRNAIRKEIIQ